MLNTYTLRILRAHRVVSIQAAGPNRERIQCACGWVATCSGRSERQVDRLIGEAHDKHVAEVRRAERWTVEKFYRSPRRGGGPEVHDGFMVTDEETAASTWVRTRAEVPGLVEGRLAAEAEARSLAGFATAAHLLSHDPGRPVVEVWLDLEGAPRPTVKAGLVGGREAEANARALLVVLGLPSIFPLTSNTEC